MRRTEWSLYAQDNNWGYLYFRPETNSFTVTVNTRNGVTKVVRLVNGKLRTPKIEKFNRMITWINQNWGLNHDTFRPNTSNIIDSAWLSGFVDADGCFDIKRSTTILKNGRVKKQFCGRLRVEQRKDDPITGESYKPALILIASDFNRLCFTCFGNDIKAQACINKSYC